MSEPIDELPTYVVAHVLDAMAADDGVAALSIEASVTGDRLLLSGTVASEPQRHRAAAVAASVAPHLTVHNDIAVVRSAPVHAPPERLA